MPEGTDISPADFAKLWAAKKGGGSTGAAPAAAGGRDLSPEEFSKAWAARKGGADTGEKMQPDIPWYVRYPEEAGRMLGFAGGGMAGGAAGSALGPVGTVAGTVAGGTAGGTAADAAIAKFNDRYYGTPSNITPETLKQDAAGNLVGAAMGEVAGPLLGRGLVGKGALEGQALEAESGAQEGLEAFGRARADAEAAASKGVDKLEQKVTKEQAPAAKAGIVAQATGRTPETTAKALEAPTVEVEGAHISGPEAIARGTETYSAVHEPFAKIRDSFDAQYDKLYGPYRDKTVSGEALGTELSSIEADFKARNQPVPALVSQAQRLLGGNPDQTAAGEAELLTTPGGVTVQRTGRGMTTGYALGGKTPEQIQELIEYQKSRGLGETAAQMEQKLPEQGLQARQPKVDELLTLQSKARTTLRRTPSGPEAEAAHRVLDGVRSTLAQAGVPGSQALDAQYRNFRTQFGDALWKKIGSAKDPTDYAGDIFNEPERAKLLMANASPEQRATLKGLYGDWVNREGAKVVKPEHAAFLKTLAPGSRLAKPGAWVYDKTQEAHLEDVLGSSEKVRQQFTDSYVKGIADIKEDLDRQTVKDAIAHAKQLGPLGKTITKNIEVAGTPEQQAEVAMKAFTNMTPRDAAIKFIQSPEFGKTAPNWIQRRLPIYGAVVLTQTARGASASGYMEGMAALGAADMARSALRKGYVWAVRNNADAWFDATKGIGVPGNLNRIGQMSARAAIDEGVSRLSQQGLGLSDLSGKSEAKPPTTAGPAVKAAETKRAEAIAGPHATKERIDTIKGVSRKIGKGTAGKPPDVTNKLKHGVVSLENVRDMMDQHGGGASVASVFKGLSAQDAIGVLAKATPEERDMLLPVVAQKINDEGKGKPPQAQEQLIAALRAAMREGAAGELG